MFGITAGDGCSEEYRKFGFYREMTSYASVFSSFWFDSGYIFRQSTEAWLFHALLREGGPRIPILTSIPPCARRFWANITHFHSEAGLVPEIDSGYMLMRQSTVTFG